MSIALFEYYALYFANIGSEHYYCFTMFCVFIPYYCHFTVYLLYSAIRFGF